MTNAELIKALRICASSGSCEACPNYADGKCKSNGVLGGWDGLFRDAADAIERLVAEVEHWKQAWKTTYDLLESMQKPYYEYDKELLADRLETCAGSICSSDAPECPYREYGAFECQQKLMCDAANAMRGKEIDNDVHTADMD